MKLFLAAIVVLLSLSTLSGDGSSFKSRRARAVHKIYAASIAKIEADVVKKMKAVQQKYLKSLASALRSARKAKNAAEVERITDVMAEVRAELENPLAAFRSLSKAEQGPGDVTFTGGSGASVEQAIVINGADGSAGAVAAQRAWLNKHRPTSQKVGQGLFLKEKKYDEIRLKGPDGTETKIYFDITTCFGSLTGDAGG